MYKVLEKKEVKGDGLGEGEDGARQMDISLPKRLIKKVDKEAKEKYMNKSEVISKAIEWYFEELEKEEDPWEEKGIKHLKHIENCLEKYHKLVKEYSERKGKIAWEDGWLDEGDKGSLKVGGLLKVKEPESADDLCI